MPRTTTQGGEPPTMLINGKQSSRPPRKAHRHDKRYASVEHLSLEAVAAFVDEELSAAAMHRARIHLVNCLQCRQEVDHQRTASETLRSDSDTITAPSSLIERLASIATSCPAGPAADERPCQPPATLLDKVDLFIRAVTRKR